MTSEVQHQDRMFQTALCSIFAGLIFTFICLAAIEGDKDPGWMTALYLFTPELTMASTGLGLWTGNNIRKGVRRAQWNELPTK